MDRLASVAAFIGVVENGGFAAAACHLNVSRTMVSDHSGPRGSLGARLLNRTTRRVSLTEIGRQYYERSTHFLAEIDEADREAGALQASPRGRLRVHCHPILARFIAPVVTAYLRDNPDVSVDLRRGDQMIDLLEEEFDLAIRLDVPPDSSLMVRRLANWRYIVCCSPSYLETHSEPVSPADLSAHNRILYTFNPFGHEWRFINPDDGGPLTVRVAGNLVTSDTELHATLLSPALGCRSFRLSTSIRSFEPVPSCRCCGTTEHPSSRSRCSIRTVSIWRRRCAFSSTRSPGCSPGATGSIRMALRIGTETRCPATQDAQGEGATDGARNVEGRQFTDIGVSLSGAARGSLARGDDLQVAGHRARTSGPSSTPRPDASWPVNGTSGWGLRCWLIQTVQASSGRATASRMVGS